MKPTPARSNSLPLLALMLTCLSTQARAADPVAPADAALAAKAVSIFGKQKGQSFDARAVSIATVPPRTDTLTLTIEPGKGAEVKASVAAGHGFVFHWVASAELAVDMHGERPGASDEYTSYAVEGALREASGLFMAPFEGEHGWYWKNRGKQPVTIKVVVTGLQSKLFRPGTP